MQNFLLYLTLTILCTTSCATLFTGTNQRISVDSKPQGAIVYIDGVNHGKTPLHDVKVKKSFNTTADLGKEIYLEHEGYEEIGYKLVADFNPVALLNVFFAPFWAIDVATGAVVKFDQNNFFYLTPKEVEETETDYNKLKQLKELYESGAITEEEFKTEKKKILEKK